jgi:hypothetical protein
VIEGVSPHPFFTVGHSTRSVAEIVELLDSAEVRLVVDVRTVPRSHRNPQFNRETLPDTLAAAQIGYEHLPALGGLRGKTPGVPADVNAFWTNQSFHNYADYAMGEAWRAGFARLLELGRTQRCAIMCAEAVWWRGHRRIIADYLLSEGETVFHILEWEPCGPRAANAGGQARHGWSSDLSRTRVTAETGAGERGDLRGRAFGLSWPGLEEMEPRLAPFGRRAEWECLARSG